MHPLLILLLLALIAPPALAASQPQITPELASQLMRILSDEEAGIDRILEELDALAKRKRRPNDLRFIIRERAALLIQENRLDVAKRELLETLAGQPQSYAPGLRFLLGQIYLVEEDAGTAIGHLEAWAVNSPAPDPAGLFVLGYAYIQVEDFAAAARTLEQLLETASVARPQWVEVLAYVYTQLGQTDRAIGLLENLVAEHPAEQRWWRQLATVYLLIEDVERGTAGFTIATMLSEMNIADARRLAQLFGYLGMPADGGALLGSMLEQGDSPPEYEDQMLLAELWMVAREFDQAIATLRQASLAAADGEPQMIMGQLFLSRERYQEAAAALRAARTAYGEEAPALAHYLLAIAELNAGNQDAAEAAISAFEDDPDFARRAAPLRAYLQSQGTR